MTSRERVLASIGHREPDRIPVDLGSTPSSGVSAIAYHHLTELLHIEPSHTRVYDVVQQLAQPELTVLDQFSVDVVDIGRTFNVREDDWYDVTLPQGIPVQFPAWFQPVRRADGSWDALSEQGERIATMPVGATFFDQTCFPYADGYPSEYRRLPEAMARVHWQALVHSPWDHAGEADFWQQLRDRAIALRADSCRALVIVAGCNLFEWGSFLRRLDNWLMDLVADQKEVERLLDALLELHLGTLERVCQAVGDVADILRFGDDLGMDSGPLMQRELYRRLFKPRHAVLCDYVHRHSQMHTFLHSCGSIYRLIPDLIEAGYEILNPVQIGTRDMEPKRLKAEFGRDVIFWGGGCDTRHVLPRSTPGEVREYVLRLLDTWSPGGGYVFNPVHNILPDVPARNIVAMFEAVEEFNAG